MGSIFDSKTNLKYIPTVFVPDELISNRLTIIIKSLSWVFGSLAFIGCLLFLFYSEFIYSVASFLFSSLTLSTGLGVARLIEQNIFMIEQINKLRQKDMQE